MTKGSHSRGSRCSASGLEGTKLRERARLRLDTLTFVAVKRICVFARLLKLSTRLTTALSAEERVPNESGHTLAPGRPGSTLPVTRSHRCLAQDRRTTRASCSQSRIFFELSSLFYQTKARRDVFFPFRKKQISFCVKFRLLV